MIFTKTSEIIYFSLEFTPSKIGIIRQLVSGPVDVYCPKMLILYFENEIFKILFLRISPTANSIYINGIPRQTSDIAYGIKNTPPPFL